MLPDLPDGQTLLRICKSIAMLDAIFSPEWEHRYYSFNSKWAPNEQMASMRTGSGDSYFILFNPHGVILKGYAHESEYAQWNVDHGQPLTGMFDGVPQEFAPFLTEPAFSMEDTTFCFWRRPADPQWNAGNVDHPPSSDPGGAHQLLAILRDDPALYAAWAAESYDVPVDPAAVKHVYNHDPLNEELVHRLNPNATMEELAGDFAEIDYPVAGP